MPKLVVLKCLERYKGWRAGVNHVHAIELVARPSPRWGLTTSTPVRCRIRFGLGREMYL